MRFNHLMNLIAFPGKVHGIANLRHRRFRCNKQDARIPCAFQVLAVLNSYIPLSDPRSQRGDVPQAKESTHTKDALNKLMARNNRS